MRRLRPLWLALGWGMAGAIAWLSLTPAPPTLEFEIGDKLGHLLGYGTLMFWFCQLYGARGARVGYGAGFIAMGVALEFVQRALGYRTYEELDMIANAFGVLIGWGLARALGDRFFERIAAFVSMRARP